MELCNYPSAQKCRYYEIEAIEIPIFRVMKQGIGCRCRNLLSKTGVSIAGGVAHNVGQLTVAALVLETAAVYTYFPVLLLAGTAAGTLIGLLGTLILKRLPQM